MSAVHLSPQRQRAMVARAQRGDTAARDLLVTSNRGLVAEIAREFLGRGVEFDDLVQEGSIGMMRAVEKFDLERPVRFSTYAAYWIRQAMGRLCETTGTANRYGYRLPAHVSQAMSRIARMRGQLERELGREATAQELSDRCEVSVDAAVQALRIAATPSPVSLQNDDDGDSREFSEQIADENADPVREIADEQRRATLKDMLDRLPDAERALLHRRYGLDGGEPVAERDLAVAWDTDRAHLQALRTSALRKLRRDPGVRALYEHAEPLPVQMRTAVARTVLRQSCGRLLPGTDPRGLDGLAITADMGQRALCGQVGCMWWLMVRDPGCGEWEVLVSDGPDGDLLTPAQAADRMRGELLVEAAEFLGRLPLAQNSGVAACAN